MIARKRMSDTANRNGLLVAIIAIFVLSGAAGLIYEVVWGRQLVLVFGNTTQSVSAILTGFFGGMAIGSALGGLVADRARRPLRMYGLLELVLVVIVLLTPLAFQLLLVIYRGMFDALVASPQLLGLVKFGLSLLALGPATILLGATLPTLTRHLARGASGLSTAFGRLYAANTFGAIVGTIAAGFILIELLGLTGTLVVGVGCSATAGTVALLLDRLSDPASSIADGDDSSPMPATKSATRSAIPSAIHPRIKLALIVAFVSGLTSLGYQVLWTRLLASGTGNSTYVFTMILAIFLTGLALGAAAFNVFRARIHTISLLAVGQIVIAFFVLVGMVALLLHDGSSAPDLLGSLRAWFANFVGLALLVVLPATVVMGLIFPATSALVADTDGHVGANTGLLLAANTLGAITGTFVLPFLVIPLIGSPATVGLMVFINLVTGVALTLAGRIEQPNTRAITAGAGVVVTIMLVIALLSGNFFVDPGLGWLRAHHGTIFQSREDEIASVQAGSLNDEPQLWVAGTSMTLLTVDTKLMPVLPLILRPQSTSNLIIGFGMGSAYRAALIAGMRVDAVELVPSVPQMFGTFYPDAPQVLANPNGHVIIADGRNYVEMTNHHYDIIVVDPPPPIYSSGVSVISSREFYTAARARLNPGGVMMQWIPFGQTVDDFKAQVRTYRSVFPHVILAFGPGGYGLYMLGSDQPLTFDPAAIQQILSRPGVVQDLSSAFDSPAHDLTGWESLIPTLVWIRGDQIAAFAGSGALVTDDHPLPEYFLLRHLFGPASPLISRHLLESLVPPPTP